MSKKTCSEEDLSEAKSGSAATIQLSELHKAIELVIRATEEDKKRNYEVALEFYEFGIERFKYAMEHEAQGDRAKESIRNKTDQYIERAEKLRQYLINKQNNGGTPSSNEDGEEKDALLKQVKDAIMIKRPNVQWSDVAGLDRAKEVLQEAVILPVKFPHLFAGKRKPPKAILLFGPPGTGKTFLAKAVATETTKSTFFTISSTHLVSKWLGESENLVKTLFEVARQQKPSIIFMDYIDSMCSYSSDKESETVRRIKTEFLLQAQGMDSDMDGILVLGATNKPWALDDDVIRSFTKKLYIPLPDETARLHLLKMSIGNTPNCLTEEDFKQLAKQTDRFSGADISALVQDALMQPIRKIQKATHFLRVSGPSSSNPNIMVDDLLVPCSPGAYGAKEMSWLDVPGDKLPQPVISMHDMLCSLENSKPSVSDTDLASFNKFMEDFGRQR